jgi:hypothetical protein
MTIKPVVPSEIKNYGDQYFLYGQIFFGFDIKDVSAVHVKA